MCGIEDALVNMRLIVQCHVYLHISMQADQHGYVYGVARITTVTQNEWTKCTLRSDYDVRELHRGPRPRYIHKMGTLNSTKPI